MTEADLFIMDLKDRDTEYRISGAHFVLSTLNDWIYQDKIEGCTEAMKKMPVSELTDSTVLAVASALRPLTGLEGYREYVERASTELRTRGLDSEADSLLRGTIQTA